MTAFSSLKIVGGLLPADLLGRVFAGDPQVPGHRAADLRPGARRVGPAAGLPVLALPAGGLAGLQAPGRRPPDAAEAASARVTRERWLRILLRELGFHQMAGGGFELEGKSFPVSHRSGHVPDPPARLGHRPGPQDPARRRPRPAVHAPGTAQPRRRLPVGDPVQRRHAAAAARLDRAGRLLLRRVRPRGDLRRGTVLRLRAPLPDLPRVPVRDPGRRRPRVLLPGAVARLRRRARRAGARSAPQRRPAGHLHPRHRVPVPPGQPAAARPPRSRATPT